jgi:hypothetical protein
MRFVVLPEGRCDTSNAVCTAGSYCVDRVCKCLNGQVYRNGRCQIAPPVNVGQSCASNERCPQHSQCSMRKVCECLSDYLLSRGECAPKPKEGKVYIVKFYTDINLVFPGDACHIRDFCLGGSGCMRGIFCSLIEI